MTRMTNGLRRRQRDDPERSGHRRRARKLLTISTVTASATRWIGSPANCWSPKVRSGRELGHQGRHGQVVQDLRPSAGRRRLFDQHGGEDSNSKASARRRSAPRMNSRRPTAPNPAVYVRPTMSAWTMSPTRSPTRPVRLCRRRGGDVSAKGDTNMGNFIAWDARPARSCGPTRSNSPPGAERGDGRRVVFYGTLEGYLKAVDAKTGKELYRFKTPSGIIGNVMTVRTRRQAIHRGAVGCRRLGRDRSGGRSAATRKRRPPGMARSIRASCRRRTRRWIPRVSVRSAAMRAWPPIRRWAAR